MMPAVPISTSPFTGPKGYGGILATLETMAKIITTISRHPRFRLFTQEIVRNAKAPEYDHEAEVRSLWSWVRRNIRYIRDPHSFEWLQSPVVTVLWRSGDCDCQTILLSSMLMSIGYPVRLVIVGNKAPEGKPPKFHHVYLSAQFRRNGELAWTDLDPTVDIGFGLPRLHSQRKTFDIGPDGTIKEVQTETKEQSTMYGLSEFFGDVVRSDEGRKVTFTVEDLEQGRKQVFEMPWNIHNLRFVSEDDAQRWIRDLRAKGVPDEDIAGALKSLASVLALPSLAAEAALPADEAAQLGAFEALDDFNGLNGFWKKLGKAVKKVALPVAGVVAAPFTGGLSLTATAGGVGKALTGAVGAMKGKKGAKAASARAPRPKKKISVDVSKGPAAEVPEVKASGAKNYLLMGGGIAAAGGAAYMLSKNNAA